MLELGLLKTGRIIDAAYSDFDFFSLIRRTFEWPLLQTPALGRSGRIARRSQDRDPDQTSANYGWHTRTDEEKKTIGERLSGVERLGLH